MDKKDSGKFGIELRCRTSGNRTYTRILQRVRVLECSNASVKRILLGNSDVSWMQMIAIRFPSEMHEGKCSGVRTATRMWESQAKQRNNAHNGTQKFSNETLYSWNLERLCAQLEARTTVDWKFVVTTRIFSLRIKDYKNPFHETPTWADYHQLLSSLHSQ